MIGGTEANFWRLALATTLLGVWAHVWGRGLTGGSLPVFLLSGVIGIGLGDVALFQALPRLGPRLTILLQSCLSAPFAALIERVWLGTKLSTPQMLCALVILFGVGIALSPKEHLHIPRKIFWAGIVASILAALGNAIGMVLSRKAYVIVRADGVSMDGGSAAYQRLIGGLLISAVVLLVAKRLAIKKQFDSSIELGLNDSTKEKWRRVWPWVVANAVAGQTLGVSCMQWALEYQPTGVVLPITATTPLMAIPFARFIEGEKPTLRSFIGGVIAVGGAAALAWVSSRH